SRNRTDELALVVHREMAPLGPGRGAPRLHDGREGDALAARLPAFDVGEYLLGVGWHGVSSRRCLRILQNDGTTFAEPTVRGSVPPRNPERFCKRFADARVDGVAGGLPAIIARRFHAGKVPAGESQRRPAMRLTVAILAACLMQAAPAFCAED